ncbi:hypothetical protein SGL43_04868 [Streptomyces globisporus]|uniref:Uncharacterized protein n=1 Tax=Streptomyces globisporus TaxID=1908 RepID=A0ABM9H2G2_STRGL|nr:hypothetical protein SGL43_04868 [Streptomyces globisporus]
MALGSDAPSLFALRDGALKYGACTEDVDGTIRGLVSVGDGCRDTGGRAAADGVRAVLRGPGRLAGSSSGIGNGSGPGGVAGLRAL